MSKNEMKLGYGQPPADKQFKAGQSGNPKGRPKKKKPVMEHPLPKYMQEINMEMLPFNRNGKTVGHLPLIAMLYRKLAIMALQGNTKAIVALINIYKFGLTQPALVPDQGFDWTAELDQAMAQAQKLEDTYIVLPKPQSPANDTGPQAKQKPDKDDDGLVAV